MPTDPAEASSDIPAPGPGAGRRIPPWLGRWLAALGTLAFAVLAVQHLSGIPGWTVRLRMAPEKISKDKDVWRWTLPAKYRSSLTTRTAVVLDNNEPLDRRARSIGDLRNSAGSMYYVRDKVRFRIDGVQDPRKNGRSYEVELPRPVPIWALALSAVTAAAGLLMYVPGRRCPAPAVTRFYVRKDLWIGLALSAAAFTWAASWIGRDANFNDGIMSINGMPYSDAVCWNELAVSTAEGRGLSIDGHFDGQRPFYPILTGILHAAGGPSLSNGLWINAASHGLAAGLIYFLGRWLGSRAVGLAGAAMVMLTPDHLLHTRLLMTETSGLALTVLSMALALSAWKRRPPEEDAAAVAPGLPFRSGLLLLSGVCFGLANLTCPFTLVAAPLYALILAGSSWRTGVRPRWKVLIPPAVLAAGVVLAIGPWVVRQKAVLGLTTLSTQTAELLYSSTFPEGPRLARATGKMEEGAALPTTERYRFYMGKFADAVKADPGSYAATVGKGFVAFFDFHDVIHPEAEAALVLVMLAGLWVRRRDPQRLAWLLAFAVIMPALLVLIRATFIKGWYAPLLPLFVASSLTAWFLGPRESRPCIAWLVATLLGCAAINAITGNLISRRCWIFADFSLWLLFFAAALAWMNHLARILAAVFKLRPGVEVPCRRGPGDVDARLFSGLAAALVLVFSAAGGVMLLGRKAQMPLSVSEADLAALKTFGGTLLPEGSPPDAAARLVVHPMQPGEYRCFIRAGSEPSNFSRAFARENFGRTLALIRLPAAGPRGAVPLRMTRFPGDVRLPAREWFAVIAAENIDPKARFGHDTVIWEAIAVVPLRNGVPDMAGATKFLPTPALRRTLANPQPTAGAPAGGDTMPSSAPEEETEDEDGEDTPEEGGMDNEPR